MQDNQNDVPQRKVLLVDDDITSLDIISYLVENRGYSVERSAEGHKAIEEVQSNPPDVLVVDLLMPGIDGIETVTRIRELGFTMPIVAFTAVDDLELHDRARQAGCDEVLTKPCRPDKLIATIEQLLANRSSH